ncbi:conserved hypothetical protein [Candidatus Desulfarcum epimagneticum]|uniref:4Fe-4S ferredoxin-type domain-containing protein n=1 Tax=uncultured Desulfobacteraceae bacterium TaxID=218296 RepID=A0A484HHZ7_9BACT|nr:conserved hypothetical protein [uncultured Desulfobacteraceae bacterium]
MKKNSPENFRNYDSRIRALVIGDGPCAAETAAALAKHNMPPVILSSPDAPAAKEAPEAVSQIAGRLVSCSPVLSVLPEGGSSKEGGSGTPGNFDVLIDSGREKTAFRAESVIIAEDEQRRALFDAHGLAENSRTLSLSRAKENPGLFEGAQTVAFLAGLAHECHPAIFSEMISLCLTLQREKNIRACLFYDHLKVSGKNAEALCREARRKGALFFSFTNRGPDIGQDETGRTRLSWVDEISKEPFEMSPDITVLDEAAGPSENLKTLSRIMGLETDANGFIQADNVHRLTVLTNRKGIFAVGASRKIQSPAGHARDTAAALLRAGAVDECPARPSPFAEIDPGACVFCLTCLRSCPHGAVAIAPRPVIIKEACAGCGACAALCPGKAISLNGFDPNDFDLDGAPAIAAFCCERSAVPALESAPDGSFPPGLSVKKVPCAAAISAEGLYSAFQNGADGALILTCHKGNCHSGRGDSDAREKAARAAGFLEQIGVDPKRIRTESLASNMGGVCRHIIEDFQKTLSKMGPLSGLKTGEKPHD